MRYYISKKGVKLPIEEGVKILITVKTYPLPSREYQELVCTAGLREDGTWIRLFPVPFRHLPFSQQYKKYHWIKTDIAKHDSDPRIESYRPYNKIEIINRLDTSNNWRERKKYVLKKVYSSLEMLQDEREVSLGTIKPKEITDLAVEEIPGRWKPKWEALYKQERLFGDKQKPLEKIPFKFSYKFRCQGKNCRGHKAMIEDWEIYSLYRNMIKKYGTKKEALEKVRNQYLNEFPTKKDLYFFMGTTRRDHYRRSFIIVGIFYPKKEK